jgi:hypothetical protein
MTRRTQFAAALMVIAVGAMGQARPADPLTEARRLYNAQQYDEAAESAKTARAIPALANAASVVYARAHLERYRHSSDAAALDEARRALAVVDAATLAPRDRVELFIALGLALYLDAGDSAQDRYTAAAELFERALAQADLLDARSRDLLFEWWALSLDRQAQQGPESDRRALYERVLTGAATEHARPDGSLSATYWVAAAARGVDDLPRALGAAIAGWIYAGSFGERGDALRTDLDALVTQVILPERARQLAAGADPRPAFDLLKVQWEQTKEKWTRAEAP